MWPLMNVPGFPPIVQSVHIMAVCAVVASAVMLNLRLVGIAVPGQLPAEMSRRLQPWWTSALGVLFVTGMVFVIARPDRYFFNPVAGIKLAAACTGIVLTIFVFRLARTILSGAKPGAGLRVLAVVSSACWILVILSGRWIAYVDYLFY